MAEKTSTPTYHNTAALLRLLGHPVRLALLAELAQSARCVSYIRDLVNIPQANVSQHLAVLREARIVACHEHGNVRCYYLLKPELVRDILHMAQHNYPIRQQTLEQVRKAAQERRPKHAKNQRP